MATIRQMRTNVRIRLRNPLAQMPNDREVFLHLLTEVTAFLNEAQQTGRAWAVDETFLNVVPNQEDYQIPIDTRFGKPLQVTTYYPQNPSHIERQVEFFKIEDMDVDWGLPNNFGQLITSPDGSPHTAFRMGWMHKSGNDQIFVRVKPVPQLAATYKVLYVLGQWAAFATLDDAPILPAYHELIEVRTAIDLLPLADWMPGDTTYNKEKRMEFAQSLPFVEQRLAAAYKQYTKGITINRRMTQRRMYPI